MRFTALVLLAMVAIAAETETLTLVDGRKLTGTYDESTQTLDMGSVKVVISNEQIKKRETATDAIDAQNKHRTQVIRQIDTKNPSDVLLEYHHQQDLADAINQKAKDELRTRIVAILRSMDLGTVVYEVSIDQKRSEIETHKKIDVLNSMLTSGMALVNLEDEYMYIKTLPDEFSNRYIKDRDRGRYNVNQYRDLAEIVANQLVKSEIMSTYNSTRVGYKIKPAQENSIKSITRDYKAWCERREIDNGNKK